MADRKAMDEKIRRQFPLVYNHPEIAYLDNSATMQRPSHVLDAMRAFYEEENANPLRGLYDLSMRATEQYEGARELVRAFLNADDASEIIFTRNATESLNLVGYSYARTFLNEGDEILITIMEHHSNLLPWMQAAKAKGAVLRYVECDENGEISDEAFRACLSDRTRIVAMTHISNVLGVRNDVKHFAKLAHEAGAVFVCDGAQSVPHIPVDVQDLDVDFLAFSGHKMGGPMGIGVLYGKKHLLDAMPPFLYGGEMIEYVRRDSATYAELPHKFEAGTVNAAGAVGLGAAIRYYWELGFETILEREKHLSRYMMEKLGALPCVHILGSKDPDNHHGIYTFTVDGVHPHDIAAILDEDGVDVRAGHHCAQPLMKFLCTLSTTRASVGFYNTEDEIDRLAESLSTVREKMGITD
jgi:cysteine desulfurase/selenocysteine lyase